MLSFLLHASVLLALGIFILKAISSTFLRLPMQLVEKLRRFMDPKEEAALLLGSKSAGVAPKPTMVLRVGMRGGLLVAGIACSPGDAEFRLLDMSIGVVVSLSAENRLS